MKRRRTCTVEGDQSISTISLVKMFFPIRSSSLSESSTLAGKFKLKSVLSVASFLIVILVWPEPSACEFGSPKDKCEDQCTFTSTDANIYPKYEAGKSYFYVFESESKTQLVNSKTDETSVLNLKGYAVLTAISSCYFDLSVVSLRSQINLQSTSSQKTSGSGYVSRPLVNHSLRFRFENGTVQRVCTIGRDSYWSRNIKKAIISLLQVTNFPKGQDAGIVEQKDVNGKCRVYVERHGNTFYKSTDLNQCTHREFGSSFVNGVPFDSPAAGFHAVPLLDSNSKCKQDIYNGIVQTSMCHEEHLLKSLSPGSPTMRTSLNTSVTFVSPQTNFKLSGQPQDYIPSSPYFQFGHEDSNEDTKTSPSDLSSLRTTLINICDDFVAQDSSTKLNLSSTLSQVTRLKQLLPKIDSENLKNLYQDIPNGLCSTKANKLSRLLLKTGVKSLSTGVIGLLTDLLLGNELNEEIRQEFLDALKFSKKPNQRSLSILEKLIKSLEDDTEENVGRNQADFLLSSSAFAYQHCKLAHNNNNCGSINEYKSLVDAIATFTLNRLREANQDTDAPDGAVSSVIVGLQALGNLNHLTAKAVETIVKCLGSKSNRVKIHALNAFRRDPCHVSLKSKAMSLLKPLKSGSDVRIHSYLAIMRCFEEVDLEGLQAIIDNEQSNQVSSFVYSHISNQLESSSPGKLPLKALLRKIHFDKETPKIMESVGKYSKNIEWSSLYRQNSIGLSSESDIVYSQNSYIPRTANLNLTLDLLGRSYNFLEAGVYLENFEFILNQLNAPRGESVDDDVEIPAEYGEDIIGRADFEANEIPKASPPPTEEPNAEEEQAERKSRISPEDLAYIRNQVRIKDRYKDVGSGDTFLRLHGTTVAVKSFTFSLEKDMFSLLQTNWWASYFNNFPGNLKNMIIDRTKPSTFLDEQIVVPTVSGLPLSLKIQGESLFASKYETNLDFEALFSRDESIYKNMSLKLFPNVASTLTAKMSIGPESFEAGFQLEGNMHLSAAADIAIEKRPGHIRTEYNFQDTRSFEVYTRLYWVASNAKPSPRRFEIRSQAQTPTEVYYDTCADDTLPRSWISNQILGLKYCYYIKLPKGLSLKNFWLQGPISFGVTSEKLDPGMKGFVLDIETDETEEGSSIKLTWDAPGSTKNRRIVLSGSYTDSPMHEARINLEFPSVHSPMALTAQFHDTDDQKGVTAKLKRGSEENENKFDVLLKMSRPKENEIVYEPVVSRTIIDTDLQLNFLNGTLKRNVGRSLDIELDLKLGSVLESCEIRGFVKADRSPNGDFEYHLSNGQISLLLPHQDPYELLVDGKLFNRQPSFGFQVNSRYGRDEPDKDISIKSEITLIPYQTLAIKTKSSSVKIPAHNIDFKFLADLELISETNQSKFTLETILENYWNIQAIRRAGSTFGSLELNVDVASWGRKIALLTERNHVDLENLTQFDFQSYLKWDAGRDESRQMALKVAFLRNDTNDEFNVLESKNELTFITQKHQAKFRVKAPKDRTNGEYLINVGYISPKSDNYDVTYRNVIRSEGSRNAASEIELTLNLPKIQPIVVSWQKSIFAVFAPNYRFRISNIFVMNLGDDRLAGIALSGAFVSQGQGSKYFHCELSLDGRLLPLHLRVKNDVRLLEDKSLEATLELARNYSGKVETEEKKGTFSLTFKPQTTRRDERDFSIEISWSPEDSQESFISKPFSFNNHLILRFTSLRDFKILNDGSLRISGGTTAWSKNIELSRSQFSTTIIFRPPEGGGTLNVNAGVQAGSGRQVFLKISTQISTIPDFNFNFRTNMQNPKQLINLSISLDQMFQFLLEHNLVNNNETDESVYKSAIVASTHSPSNELRLTNDIVLLPFELRVESGCYVAIGNYFKIDSVFEGKLAKSAENESKWYTVMALKKRPGKNEIPDGDQPFITFSGPIFLTDDSVKSTLLLEWPALHHSHVLVRMQVDLSRESTDGESSLGTNLILNISGYDKKISLQELLEKDPKVSDLIDPTFNSQTEASAFSNFNVKTLVSTPETGGRKLSVSIRSSSGSPSNYLLPTEVNVELQKSDLVKKIYLDLKLKDGAEGEEEKQYSFDLTSADEADGDFAQRKLHLITTRNANVHSKIVNITSGFRWVASVSTEHDHEQYEQTRTKALCLVAEKVLGADGDFKTCTLGFNSSTRRIPGEEESTDLKLVLLDRIGFRGLKLEQNNLFALNSSFWLDSIDKPDEELRFSVVKKRILRNEMIDPEGTFWGPDHAGQLFLTAKHPFFTKDLQVKTSIGPDPTDWNSPNIKGLVELDIFNQEDDKIIAEVEVTIDKPKAEPSDDFIGFYDMDEDYSGRIGESGVEKPRQFTISLVSQGLNLNFRGEGKTDFSSGISYSILDRHLETKEGKIIFRPPSLLDSNVFQVGPTPIVTISFGGIPTINLQDPNSENALALEYYASPQPTFRLFANDFPENTFYSLAFPPKDEEEFLIEFNYDNATTHTKVFHINAALNTSKLLQIRTDWSYQALGSTWNDLKQLNAAIFRGIKTEVKNITKEIHLNVRHYSEKIANALPNLQPLLDKLDREIQEDLEEIRNNSPSNIVYEHISTSMLTLYHKAKSQALNAIQAVKTIKLDFVSRVEQSGVPSFDEIPSKILTWANKMAEESVSIFFLTISSVKKGFWDSMDKLAEYIESNPELKKVLDDAKDYLGSFKAVLKNLFRKALHRTIALRPYLRYLLPKEAHEFLITLKHYYLGKLELGGVGGQQDDRSSNLVTSEQVFAEGYNAATIIGRRALEGKGFLFQKQNESFLIQFPLLKPARRLQEVFSRSEFVRPKYTQSFRDFFHWIANADIQESRNPRWSTMKSRVENAFLGGIGPDDAVGMIIGGTFYRTFDGKFHRFDGSCQYLLAADFLSENVTVHVERDAEAEDMQELIFSDGEDFISVLQNTTVLYNGRRVEIPLTESLADFRTKELGSFSALRYNVIGEVVEISKKHSGITLACLVDYPVCTIRFKSYLYGRALGLLGTNNLENYDDFSTPSGEIVGKTSKFYRSWRLNRECRETKGNPPVKEAPAEVKERCSYFFADETSPLRSCFSVIHPSDFQEICEALQMENTEDLPNHSVCSAVAAYWIECREQRIPVSFVDGCEYQ